MNDEIKNVDQLFLDLQQNVDGVKTKRMELINQLMQAAKSIKFDPDNDKASITEAKISLINAVDSVLKNHEASANTIINTALKRKDSDANAKKAESVATMLRMIDPKTAGKALANVADPEKVDELLEKQFDEASYPISDAELKEVEDPDIVDVINDKSDKE